MTAVLVGGGGVLGSGYRAALRSRSAGVVRLRPPWSQGPRLEEWFARELPGALPERGPVVLVWAAGVGHVGAEPDALETETAALRGLATALRRAAPDRQAATTVVLASSAGALFAGAAGSVIDDRTAPAPLSAYGHVKLAQEELLRGLADDTPCRVVSCRLSNVFGLASGRVTRRGLVSSAVRATRLGAPLTLFVSPDTRRDYLDSTDAARAALHAADRAPAGFTPVLLRDGQTRSVVHVLGVVATVARRRVPVTYADRPETRHQPRSLRFSPPPRELALERRTPFELAVGRMLGAPLG